MAKTDLIWVRGAGELGSAVAHLLHRLSFDVILSDIEPPLAIRRPVTFSDAIYHGSWEVEGVSAKYCENRLLPEPPWDEIPLINDTGTSLEHSSPTVLVDCRMLKSGQTDMRPWAKLVIGLGPGFDTALNCHIIIETKRGHDLGRVISQGNAISDTGIPGKLGGESAKRLVRAPKAGFVKWHIGFGDLVEESQVLGVLSDHTPIQANTSGMVRGLISEQTPVTLGMKIGDVDPRGDTVNYKQISDKARTIAHGVLEAILLRDGSR